MKLAKNTALERNLEKQLPIYQAASDAKHGIKVIIYFSEQEKLRVDAVLRKLKLTGHEDIVLDDVTNGATTVGFRSGDHLSSQSIGA